jgi:hypothetical protein
MGSKRGEAARGPLVGDEVRGNEERGWATNFAEEAAMHPALHPTGWPGHAAPTDRKKLHDRFADAPSEKSGGRE